MRPPKSSEARLRPSERAAKLGRKTPLVKPAQPNAAARRQIPSVDELLLRPQLREMANRAGRAWVTDTTRAVLAELRKNLAVTSPGGEVTTVSVPDIAGRIVSEVERGLSPSLAPVINATGVVLHTNLGRAPLSLEAVEHLREAATHYSNLEYDLPSGKRGKRDVHTSDMLAKLAGAEAAIVVNNNAAGIFLVLITLAKGAEVIVSRGELIEIGDGFRIPDILAESGAILREVGTTNRTRIGDYQRAINERTRLLLRVHRSNFRISGFTEQASLESLAALGRKFGIPVLDDLGSGCLVDLSASGVAEPVVRASLQAGASIVAFSGDKLLGGPQAGIIAGKKKWIERVRRNPMFRALRVDKLTIAVLEVTLRAYLRGQWDEIPALRLIRLSAEEIGTRAAAFVETLRSGELPPGTQISVRDGVSVIGGGSTPEQKLATRLVAIGGGGAHSAAELEARLRRPASGAVPVIARVEGGALLLDLRTVFPGEEAQLGAALAAALR
ncbi:MAG: L-seryl-tRNA(Sec) selenium transferase [Candidatus Acidiferrales bacterium]